MLPVLAAACGLGGCFAPPPPQQTPVSPASASACEQRARQLGYLVLFSGQAVARSDGGYMVPINVTWGSGGGAIVNCIVDARGNMIIN
jgi:hypothetical protein